MPMPIQRTIFSEEHELFRSSVRRFMEEEIAPHMDRWRQQGYVDRELWRLAGETGLLCVTMPEEYGGAGADRKYSAILIEEQARINAAGPGFPMHSDIVAPYILRFGSPEQKAQWLPKMARGEAIGSIGMTEPGAGSDLKKIKTTAQRVGDEWVINGSKIFITNGFITDLIVLVAKTDPTLGSKGISLFLVEADRAGFSKGQPLNKIGQQAQDTAEIFLNNVRVPATNLLGQEGKGFGYLMEELAWERLMIAIRSVAGAVEAIEQTVAYTKERQAFGQSVIEFQNSRFKLAECKTKTQIARVYADHCLDLVSRGELDPEAAAMAKWWCTELQNRVLDECVQLHGGYGYILDYPIARAWTDARAQMIYGGTNEIMKEIIGRKL
jgi:alkylation response protein AidB-like acyl-CoA dehydrogenase